MKSDAISLYVSTTQVAKALGISVSTVKRWVDEGILSAQKTAGGHRKLLLADVLNLAQRGRLPIADLSHLAAADARKGARTKATAKEFADSLFRALRDGDADRVPLLVKGAIRRGISVEDLGDYAIRPAMERIGREWESGRLDVMEEHRASQLCASALFELKALLEKRAPRHRPRAVGGAPAGDFSVLPALLAQMVLIESGWDATNLGPNTPFSSLARAIVVLKPKLLWLSVCHLSDAAEFVQGYRDLFQIAHRAGVAVAIGGRAMVDSIRVLIPFTTFGDRLSHLGEFARTLNPAPPLPRRGRPPGKKLP